MWLAELTVYQTTCTEDKLSSPTPRQTDYGCSTILLHPQTNCLLLFHDPPQPLYRLIVAVPQSSYTPRQTVCCCSVILLTLIQTDCGCSTILLHPQTAPSPLSRHSTWEMIKLHWLQLKQSANKRKLSSVELFFVLSFSFVKPCQ